MKSIWKFETSVESELEVMMPKGAEILAFDAQRDKPVIWAIIELGATMEARRFRLVGTGHKFENIPGKYIGTAQIFDGDLVWHLFEVTK